VVDSTKLLKLFNLADRDKSGKLTADELLPIVKAVVKPGIVVDPSHVQMLMEMLDKDGDASVTIDEFLEGAKKFNWDQDVLSDIISKNSNLTSNAPSADALSDIEIPFSEVKMTQKLGEGTFGVVYKGDWRGSSVAVKVMKMQNVTEQALLEFRKELNILSRLRHPNVVLLMGACTSPPNLCFITEFLAGGSLYDALHSKKLQMNMPLFKKLAREIAQGMNYLHLKNIVHRDLKSLNLLLDSFNNIKICDFGLSKSKSAGDVMTKSIGTPIWMAPELLKGEDYDEKVDVYAFGIILWEIGTGELPFSTLDSVQIALAVCTKGLRPPIPAQWPQNLKDLIQQCWHESPSQRPSFQIILSKLDALQL